MRSYSLSTLVAASFALLATADPPSLISNTTIFIPPSDWRSHSTSYARVLLLNQACETDNVLLTTFAINPPDEAYLPIFKSTDGGYTWAELSQIYFDDSAGGGAIMQPFIYELPIQVGDYPRGTILATGNAIPPDFSSTNIDIYASLDKGATWNFASTVTTGGPPNDTNGADPVWEPFINTYNGQVVVYYSDQRDPLYGQKLSHQASPDLVNWGPVVNDITNAKYTLRPGMTIVAQMGNGKYIIAYELGPEAMAGARYPVHYRIADSPLEFENATDFLLKPVNNGTIPNSAPYVTWTPAGGPNGTIVVSDGFHADLWLNTAYGDPNVWSKVSSGLGPGYSRSLQVMPNSSVVLVVDGGLYGRASTSVTAGEFVVPGPRSPANTSSTCK